MKLTRIQLVFSVPREKACAERRQLMLENRQQFNGFGYLVQRFAAGNRDAFEVVCFRSSFNLWRNFYR